jgi:hypothetical protein
MSNWVRRKSVEARLRSGVLPASLQPGVTHYRQPAPPAIAAREAMIAAPSSVNRAAVSSSRCNRASCQSRRSLAYDVGRDMLSL